MQHDENRGSQVLRQVLDQQRQSLNASGGRANYNDVPDISTSIVSGCCHISNSSIEDATCDQLIRGSLPLAAPQSTTQHSRRTTFVNVCKSLRLISVVLCENACLVILKREGSRTPSHALDVLVGVGTERWGPSSTDVADVRFVGACLLITCAQQREPIAASGRLQSDGAFRRQANGEPLPISRKRTVSFDE